MGRTGTCCLTTTTTTTRTRCLLLTPLILRPSNRCPSWITRIIIIWIRTTTPSTPTTRFFLPRWRRRRWVRMEWWLEPIPWSRVPWCRPGRCRIQICNIHPWINTHSHSFRPFRSLVWVFSAYSLISSNQDGFQCHFIGYLQAWSWEEVHWRLFAWISPTTHWKVFFWRPFWFFRFLEKRKQRVWTKRVKYDVGSILSWLFCLGP